MNETIPRDTKTALLWIVSILKKHNVPFQIAGGFAARLYGSTRELADIDIDVPNEAFDMLYPLVNEYVTFGPSQYVDDNWNLRLMTLEYRGQVIDIAGEAQIFDQNTKTWIAHKPNFTQNTILSAYGIDIPLIPKEKLIAYKRKLLREVDKEDIINLI